LCYRRALKVNRHGVQVQFHLGEVLAQLGLRDDAIASWRNALTWQPQHLPSLLALGDLLRAYAPADAAASYERALAVEAHDVRARRGLALARLAIGDAQGYGDTNATLANDSAAFEAWDEVARILGAS